VREPFGFVGYTVRGDKTTIAKLGKVSADADDIVEAGLAVGAEIVAAKAVVNIRQHGLIDTGYMMNTTEAGEVQRVGQQVHVDIGTKAEYGIYHELGTIRLPARPFLRPALLSSEGEIRRAVGWQVDQAIARARAGGV